MHSSAGKALPSGCATQFVRLLAEQFLDGAINPKVGYRRGLQRCKSLAYPRRRWPGRWIRAGCAFAPCSQQLFDGARPARRLSAMPSSSGGRARTRARQSFDSLPSMPPCASWCPVGSATDSRARATFSIMPSNCFSSTNARLRVEMAARSCCWIWLCRNENASKMTIARLAGSTASKSRLRKVAGKSVEAVGPVTVKAFLPLKAG